MPTDPRSGYKRRYTMIPFNHLGWFFNLFGTKAYSDAVIQDLCETLSVVPQNGALLDLGAGTGVVGTFALGCRGDLRFTAADPAPGMLQYVPEPVQKVSARAEALPFDNDTFDAVLLGEALHHFSRPDDALGEIARVMRGGGVLFVFEFDPSVFLGRLIRGGEKLLGEPGHFYPPQTLAAMLEAHGFSVRIRAHGWRYTLCAVFAA